MAVVPVGRARDRAATALASVGIIVLLVAVLFATVPASGSNLASQAAFPAGLTSAPPPSTAFTVVAPGFSPDLSTHEVGALASQVPLDIAVALGSKDPAGFAALTDLLYTPGTSEFHHFLSAVAVAERFGAPASTYASAVRYFESFGLTVTTSPDQLLLFVNGSSASVGRAFHTSFEVYSEGDREFYDHASPASLPASLETSGVLGLANNTELRPASLGSGSALAALDPLASCSASQPLTPCQLQTAYNSTGLLTGGTTGSGVTIGVVDNYDSAEPQSQLALDLADFDAEFGLPAPPLNFVYPVPTSTDLNASPSSQWGVEEALDLQWSHAMAPGAAIDMTFAPNPSVGLYEAVDWLVAHQSVDIITMSWGEPDAGVFNAYSTPCANACNASTDGSYGILSPVLSAAAAEGISLFAASGDCGAADGTSGVATNYPASDPSVTGVGGTDLTVSASGGYASETAWSGNATGAISPGCTNQGGSGGGYAPFPKPWWQAGEGVSASIPYRGVPDVSADAANPVVVYYRGDAISVGGTSLSSPVWAGFTALADQLGGTSLGSLNPQMYALLRSPAYREVFHDITSGNNGAYSAAPGWDPITGIGSPNVGRLAPLLVRTLPLVNTFLVRLTGTPRYAPAPAAVTFQIGISGGASPYPLIDVAFGDGAAGIVSGTSIHHTYATPGVYTAEAAAYDGSGNLSFSIPLVVVIGGGTALHVTLTPSTVTPAVGEPVTWMVSAVGGTGPYSYAYWFGDGTFQNWSNRSTVSHTYEFSAGVCAIAAAMDSASPPDGGTSARVSLQVGGASAPDCFNNATSLNASMAPSPLAVDAPGDLQFGLHATGGTPPYSFQYASSDPYVAACECGIFRTPGVYPVEAFVNDSLGEATTTWTNVTIYPAINATFAATRQSGLAPLNVTFSVTASGGHNLSAASTLWQFGDGESASGSEVNHTFETPGYYLTIGRLSDGTEGNASEAFLLDVLPASSEGRPAVVATVTPAIDASAGAPVTFHATEINGSGNSTFYWDLGDDDSAYGATVAQTYSATGCLGTGACPLDVTLSYRGPNGTWVPLSIVLSHPIANRWSALSLADQISNPNGTVPLRVNGTAQTAGVPGATLTWQFGTGAEETGPSASYVYALPGEYTLTEVATTDYGDRLLRTHAVTITAAIAPIAITVVANPTHGPAPLTVDFSASASGGNGGPYTFHWDFGDSFEGNGSTVAHTYASPGIFSVNLNVSDSSGDSNTTSTMIQVVAPPTSAADAGESEAILLAGAAVGVVLAVGGLGRRKEPPNGESPPISP
ncbi:MAG: PKD domain-containing protein [Thermoplasmata archaeon]